jgi:ligand-binding sensor domain-containing protein
MQVRLRNGIVLLLYFAIHNLSAQPLLSFEHLSLREGLSQSVPNDIHQDKEGFLWIATQDGLNRYDGYTFKIFKNQADDTTSLSHSWIWKVVEDADQNLWIATWNGLNRYDRVRDQFTRYNRIQDGAIANARTNNVFIDSDGRLWVGTWGNGLFFYDADQDRFEPLAFPDQSSASASLIRCLFEDQKHTLWAGTFGSGLFKVDPDLKKLVQAENDQLETERITAITEDLQGNLWLGTYSNGLLVWNKTISKPIKYNKQAISDNQITALLRDRENQIWIGTREGGINLYNSDTFTQWLHLASDETSVAGNHIFSLFQDHSGIVWIGSSGLSKYDKRRKKFTHITHQQNVPTTLSNRVIRHIFEDSKGRIWIGTEGGGLNQLNAQYEVINRYLHNPNDQSSISNNDVRSIVEHSDGTLWVGTLGGGLNRFNPATEKFTHYSARKDFPAGANNIQHLMLDREGILWIGTIRDGIFWYNPTSDSFIRPDFIASDSVTISSGYVNRIDQDLAGNVWISGWGGGLAMRPPSSDTLIRYLHNPQRTVSLANDIVYSTHVDRKGRLWIGTAGGLNLLVKQKSKGFNQFDEEFILYSERHGLTNNVVYGIVEDQSGTLWLSTNYGLSSFDPESGEFKNYHQDDGLQEEEFNANAYLRCRDGRLVFGGINGINLFKPEELFINEEIPPVSITAMNIFEKPFQEFRAQPINLRHNQNFISFEFVAMDFMAPQRNTFAYKLEGLEDEWVMAGQRRYASYTDLKPGSYVFRVIASNNDGIWNETGAALAFTIAYPFWQKPWFILAVTVVLAFIMYSIYRYRVEQKLKVERLRTKIAGDLHDEVGSSLTRISMYSDLLASDIDATTKGSYLGSIRELSREVVSTMSDIVWSIDNRSDSLGDLLLRMKDFASQFLAPRNIEVEFHTENLKEKTILSPQLKQNLYLIFKEALHNIVKHSSANKVTILILNNATGLTMEISDNGKGFSGDAENKGNGLRNMRKRASDINATLQIVNHNGTTVKLTGHVLI